MDIDDHTNNGSPDGMNSRSQEVWGLRYIDDAMVRLLDKNLDGDCLDSGELFWQLSDAQFSTVAVIDKNAVLQERVSYTSYGVGTHRWPHEVNNTGGVTTSGSTSDYGVINGLATANSGAGTPISDTTYNVAADLNRDGVIDSTDTSIFTSTFGGAKSALAGGLISDPNGPDNVFGYDGYVYNPDQGLYTVRFRWYSPTFGRWPERDPAGYVDGRNTYQAVLGRPQAARDPMGLSATSSKYPTSPCPNSKIDSTCEDAINRCKQLLELAVSIQRHLDQARQSAAIAMEDYLDSKSSSNCEVVARDSIRAALQAADEEMQAMAPIASDYHSKDCATVLGNGDTLYAAARKEVDQRDFDAQWRAISSGRVESDWERFFALSSLGAGAFALCAERAVVGECSGVQANKLAGDAVRDIIAARESPAITEQCFSTVGGPRFIDILKLGDRTLAIESKVGRTALDARVRQELARDWWFRRQGQVGDVRWEFTPSQVTGKCGPTQPLLEKL
ncbi:MAG: RHS repeat-associated core domain-containing protein [Phycisphaerales bacterium]